MSRKRRGRDDQPCKVLGAPGRGLGLSTESEDSELDRLRTQVSELRSRLAEAEKHASQPRQRVGWRGPVAALLIVIGCVLTPVSVMAVWSANQVSNTDRYVANVAPLISAPAVRGALADKISTKISEQVNVQGLTKQAATQLSKRGLTRLGGLLSGLSGSIASGVNGLIHTLVAKIVTSQQVARLWVEGNRLAHAQMVKALSGKSSALSVSNGKVVIGLGPFIDKVKHGLAARGVPLVDKLPPINPTFPLFDAKYLVKAQSLYRALTALKWALPLIALIALAAGIYIARRHRRALVGAGLGVAASMVVLGIGIAIARTIYLNKVPSSVLPADAAAVVFDTLVRYIRQGLRVLLVLGLVVALAGFLTGPSVTAVRTRAGFASGFAFVRGTGERAGITTGPVGIWVHGHRLALRIASVVGAALIFVFWSDPTGLVVL